jgi:hypothetical protein
MYRDELIDDCDEQGHERQRRSRALANQLPPRPLVTAKVSDGGGVLSSPWRFSCPSSS